MLFPAHCSRSEPAACEMQSGSSQSRRANHSPKAQRRNLENHEALIREKVHEGKLNESDIVAISIDKAVQGPFNITFS
eukprot:2060286-Pyramimonas_sp.AAC.1